MPEKPLAWLGSSLDDVRAFPDDARRDAGYQLGRVQQGLLPTDWKPMAGVGPGVIEIRVHTSVEHRVFYVAKFDECGIRNPRVRESDPPDTQSDLALAQKRLADLIRRRARKPEAS